FKNTNFQRLLKYLIKFIYLHKKKLIMKKIMFSFFALLAITISLVSWKVSGTPAVHAEGDYCWFYTHDYGNGTGELSLGSFKYVENQNNATLTCKATGVHTYSKNAEIIRGESNSGLPGACTISGVTTNTPEIATDDWQVVTSPSGNASCVCHFDKRQ
ncbi:MAG: hypothetical protein ABIW34_13260, partial [Ginsengibacter sp.]